MERINWTRNDYAGWTADVGGNVTLVVTPDRYARGITAKAARGTKWHAQATHWDATTSCASRFGRDVYGDLQDSADAAKRLAETIYREALAQ